MAPAPPDAATAAGALRRAVAYLLAGHLFLGLAHVAMLPPWEGFDETAHYSYLQQLADRGELPRWTVARLSQDVEGYARIAPIPYASMAPMEKNGGLTYKAFFESPSEARTRGRALVHGLPDAAREYAPGTALNWQAQHPPLYYWVLAPVYRTTRHLSWAMHLFWLRLVSYLLAWLALVLAVYAGATAIRTPPGHRGIAEWAMLGIALWPVVAPAWFPEMARLGNDSLAALLVAGLWLVLVRAVGAGLSLGSALALGLLIGAGGLTKAFFMPIGLGIVGFWLVHAWEAGGLPTLGRTACRLALVVGVAAGLAGWWYVGNWRAFGVPLGAVELILLEQGGGLLPGLHARFSLPAWVRGHAASVVTVAWSGTWSLAQPPYMFLAPLVMLALTTAGAYVRALWQRRAGEWAWLPVWLLAPVAIGLSYHVLVRIALSGEGRGTPGWYLHVLTAALGSALGVGLGTWWRSSAFRTTVVALVGYAVLFAATITWAQVLLFAGWFFKAGESKFYQAPTVLPPLFGLPEALERLRALAYPTLGKAAWVVGAGLVLVGLIGAWNGTRTRRDAPESTGPVPAV